MFIDITQLFCLIALSSIVIKFLRFASTLIELPEKFVCQNDVEQFNDTCNEAISFRAAITNGFEHSTTHLSPIQALDEIQIGGVRNAPVHDEDLVVHDGAEGQPTVDALYQLQEFLGVVLERGQATRESRDGKEPDDYLCVVRDQSLVGRRSN